MKTFEALGILIATPAVLVAAPARAWDGADPSEPFRPLDPIQDSIYEEMQERHILSPYPERDAFSGPGHAWVSIGSYWKGWTDGRQDLGLMVTVAFPLDRMAADRIRIVTSRQGLSEPGGEVQEPKAGKAPAPPSNEAAEPVAAVHVSPKVARACVRAAWRAQGLETDGDLDRMAARARLSSALPEVRIRASRGWDETFRTLPTDSDPYRSQDVTGGTRWLEGRLTWRLDRAVFADEEIPIEKLRTHRTDARTRLAGRVLSILFQWQRAVLGAADPSTSTEQHIQAVLQQAEAEAVLDVLTAGWFSSWLAQGK